MYSVVTGIWYVIIISIRVFVTTKVQDIKYHTPNRPFLAVKNMYDVVKKFKSVFPLR